MLLLPALWYILTNQRGYPQTFVAVVQDDTGITYRTYVDRGWQTILYGTYTHPIDLFSSSVYQKALNDAYTTRKDIRPLGFRFGYNYKGSSLIVALRPETKSE